MAHPDRLRKRKAFTAGRLPDRSWQACRCRCARKHIPVIPTIVSYGYRLVALSEPLKAIEVDLAYGCRGYELEVLVDLGR